VGGGAETPQNAYAAVAWVEKSGEEENKKASNEGGKGRDSCSPGFE